jgi:hypothetical protein
VLNQKWWLTYAGVLSAAYLYLRPLIRRRLGSAEQGYINFYSVYIAWLCSAVFLHLPSVGRLGVDFKADLSILLTTFLVSHTWCPAGACGILHACSDSSTCTRAPHCRVRFTAGSCLQVTLVAVGIAHGLHGLAVTLHIMAPSLYNPSAGKKEIASIALLNSVTLAVACRLATDGCIPDVRRLRPHCY